MRIIEILDILQLISWSGTYLLILYYGFRYREFQPQMPYVAGTNNLAWELAVVIKSGGFGIQLIWLVLDAFIWVQNGKRLKDAERRRNIYIYIRRSDLFCDYVDCAPLGIGNVDFIVPD